MIDWLEFIVPCAAARELRASVVMAVDSDGAIEWRTFKWMQARGSYDGSLSLRPIGGDTIHLSGSPAKFLQGHNLFGSDDLPGLVRLVFDKATRALSIPVEDSERALVEAGNVELLRTDINYSFVMPSRSDVLAWIRGAEQHGYLQHRGRGMLRGTTVVWGEGSRHWLLKAYCKGQEIEARGHRLPNELRGVGLEAWADDKLRVEVQLRARALRALGAHRPALWNDETAQRIFGLHIAKLNLAGEMRVTESEVAKLPQGVRTSYLLWKSGQDVRAIVSRPTFYRHRRELLALGVDLAVAPPDARSNVVPLIRYLEARPARVPEWAYGTPLYVEPRLVA